MKSVAVLTPCFKDYLLYIREQTDGEEKYDWVYNVKSVRGKCYNRVEKLFNYYMIADIDEIIDYLETHIEQ